MRTLLSTALIAAVLLGGCKEEAPKPKAKPAPVAQKVDPAAAQAKEMQEAGKRTQAVLELLKAKHPEIVSVSPIINEINLDKAKFYEVITPAGILYTTATVDAVFLGSMLVGQGKDVQNLTNRPQAQKMLAELQAAQTATTGANDLFGSMMQQEGLNYTYGTGANQIITFEDPDCGACQDLHKNLDVFGERLNLSVRVFPYVLSNKHPQGIARAKALMCAPAPETAWKAWMVRAAGQTKLDNLWATFAKENSLTDISCPKAAIVDTWQEVGSKLGLSATPSIMFPSGMVAEGSMSEADFVQALEMSSQQLSGAQPVAPQAPSPSPMGGLGGGAADPTAMLPSAADMGLSATPPAPAPAVASPATPTPTTGAKIGQPVVCKDGKCN